VKLTWLLLAVEDEIPELCEQIRKFIKKMEKGGSNVEDDVPGGSYKMCASLTGLMGDLRLHDKEHRKQMEELKVSMKEKGKPLREIALAVQEKYEQIIAGKMVIAHNCLIERSLLLYNVGRTF